MTELCTVCARGLGGRTVNGYITTNGTYVAPHHATNPNGTWVDNWSSCGNSNPYTGQMGTKEPYATPTNPAGQLSPQTQPYQTQPHPR